MFRGWNYDGEPPLPPNLGQMMGQLGGGGVERKTTTAVRKQKYTVRQENRRAHHGQSFRNTPKK